MFSLLEQLVNLINTEAESVVIINIRENRKLYKKGIVILVSYIRILYE